MDRGEKIPLFLYLLACLCFGFVSTWAMKQEIATEAHIQEDPAFVKWLSEQATVDGVEAKRVYYTPADNPYLILGIDVGSDVGAATSAYRRLARKYPAAAKEVNPVQRILFEKINAAYNLIKSVQNPNELDQDGRTPLHIALLASDEKTALFLLNFGANPNLVFNQETMIPVPNTGMSMQVMICGYTPLAIAIEKKSSLGLINRLLERGANTSAVITIKKAGTEQVVARTVAFDTARNLRDTGVVTETLGVLKLYEENRIKAAIASDSVNETDLCMAAMVGSIMTVDALLRAGANVNVVDGCGRTPLFYAVTNKDEKMVELLLRFKANPNCVVPNFMNDGYTILHMAVDQGLDVIVRLLLVFGADVNKMCIETVNCEVPETTIFGMPTGKTMALTTTSHGKTALFIAIMAKRDLALIESLIRSGAALYAVMNIHIDIAGRGGMDQSLSLGEAADKVSYGEVHSLLDKYRKMRLARRFLSRARTAVPAFFSRNYKYTTGYRATMKRLFDRFRKWASSKVFSQKKTPVTVQPPTHTESVVGQEVLQAVTAGIGVGGEGSSAVSTTGHKSKIEEVD